MSSSTSSYLYDADWHQERERLAGIEALWDPGSQALLQRLGIGEGSRCLEVGAGGGALAEWMCGRVGDSGRVLATDLDTRFVEAVDSPVMECLRHDIAQDDLPDERFDLIHSRMVLEHIPRRAEVLERLVTLLAPGGWMLIEDYDMGAFGADPPSEVGERIGEVIIDLMAELGGFDAMFGRRLRRELARVGLEEVGAEGRAQVIDATHPGVAFFRLTIDALREQIVARGMTEAEIDDARAIFDDPDRLVVTPLQIAAWGRAPA